MLSRNEQLNRVGTNLIVAPSSTTTAKAVAKKLLSGEATMRQLAHDSFLVELPIQTEEFDLAEYDCWGDLHKEIVETVGNDYKIIEVPNGIEEYVVNEEIEVAVFELMQHPFPLVVWDYAQTEGVALTTALYEAEKYLIGDKNFPVEESMIHQWAQERGLDL